MPDEPHQNAPEPSPTSRAPDANASDDDRRWETTGGLCIRSGGFLLLIVVALVIGTWFLVTKLSDDAEAPGLRPVGSPELRPDRRPRLRALTLPALAPTVRCKVREGRAVLGGMRRPTRFALLALLLLPACGHAAAEASAAPRAPDAPAAPTALKPRRPQALRPRRRFRRPPPTSPGANASAAPPSASLRAPLVTYSGQLDLRVNDAPTRAIDAVVGVAESVGGYLSTRGDASVEVRVPSARFREAMTRLEPLGEVTHRSVTATDVSDEFHDAEVRLQNLRATRARQEGLLAHAGSLADTLAVERELERVALEIDRIEGRLEYLKSRVAYSSITVNVEALPLTPKVALGATPKRFIAIPVAWLGDLGVERLLTLH